MLTTVKGVYCGGKIELVEIPRDVREGTPVIVTFLNHERKPERSVRYPLRGKPIRYIDPFGSVSEKEWDVLR